MKWLRKQSLNLDEQVYSFFVRPLVMQDQAAKCQEFTREEKTLSESWYSRMSYCLNDRCCWPAGRADWWRCSGVAQPPLCRLSGASSEWQMCTRRHNLWQCDNCNMSWHLGTRGSCSVCPRPSTASPRRSSSSLQVSQNLLTCSIIIHLNLNCKL